jgi:flavin-binding protein dodecin
MVEKSIELTGASANSIEDAVSIALARAAVTIDSIRQVHVEDISATVEDGAVAHWRVRIRITFAVQDRLHE